MNFPGLQYARSKVNAVRKRFLPRGLILMYHSVGEKRSDPWRIGVSTRHFNEHLQVIERLYQPLSMKQVVQSAESNKLRNKSIAVTFDDGYQDNYFNALPLLEKSNIPATIFVTTRHIDQNRAYWWEQLADIVLNAPVLPGTLELEANGNLYAFDLNGKNDFFDRNFGAFTGLSYWNPNPDPRHKLYFSLWKILRESTPVRQQAILDKLAGWAGASGSGYAMNYTFSTEQLVALSRQPLVEIGAHTVNHPSLPALPARDQEAEIKQSRNRWSISPTNRLRIFRIPTEIIRR
jgi:peptidoglycan/xylan/chitin deacetylase (PgdA/CDA1 family)